MQNSVGRKENKDVKTERKRNTGLRSTMRSEPRRSIRRSDRGSEKSETFLRSLVTTGRSAHIYSITCPGLTRAKTKINCKGGVAALAFFPDEHGQSEQMRKA